MVILESNFGKRTKAPKDKLVFKKEHAEGLMTRRNNNNPTGGPNDANDTNTTMTYKQIAHEGERGNRIHDNDKQQDNLLLCTKEHVEGLMTQRNNDNNPSGGLSEYDKVEKNTLSLSEPNSILINFDDSNNTNTTMTYKPIAHEGERQNQIYSNDKQQGYLHGYDISPNNNLNNDVYSNKRS